MPKSVEQQSNKKCFIWLLLMENLLLLIDENVGTQIKNSQHLGLTKVKGL